VAGSIIVDNSRVIGIEYGIRVRDKRGDFLLVAIARGPLGNKNCLIKKVIEMNPSELVERSSSDGNTFLHLVAQSYKNAELLQYLITEFQLGDERQTPGSAMEIEGNEAADRENGKAKEAIPQEEKNKQDEASCEQSTPHFNVLIKEALGIPNFRGQTPLIASLRPYSSVSRSNTKMVFPARV